MLNYVNNFSVSASGNGNEYILSFKQTYPNIDPSGKVVDMALDTVANVVLTRDGLNALKQLINDIPALPQTGIPETVEIEVKDK